MKKLSNYLALAVLFACTFTTAQTTAQETDWRNVKNGNLISLNGYCDQPYAVVLKNGTWLCVFTTGATAEGTGGQHIVSCTSQDQGKTWTKTVAIEPPGTESASWAMPYLTRYGRVYVFYDYNGDKIHNLNGQTNIREDMLGWYCYKYSDDEGKTWSERYRLDVRKTGIDFNNDWKGDVQILWGIGKPVDVDKGMMFAFSKMGKYLIDSTEGWFFRCDNINTEKNISKLKWTLLPGGDQGIKNPALGPINEEQNIFQMSNGTLYCMERTISGHPAESYSYNGGKTWTVPQVPKYLNGIELKNPRACPRIWKCKNGKYLFWYHNNGNWNFQHRNPAWVSGGIEKDGKIVWGQPEIMLYEDDITKRMSYPDLIEQDGKYWVTETNKEHARSNAIPAAFFNTLWSQFDLKAVATKDLVHEWKNGERNMTLPAANFSRGFTLDLKLRLGDLAPGQTVLTSTANGKSVTVKTAEYGSLEIILKDGTDSSRWNSDPGLIPAHGEHGITITVDNGPKIIQFVVDGIVCNGRDFRQYGWGRFKVNMADFNFSSIDIGELANGSLQPRGKLSELRIYNRPLMNTEAIGNHNTYKQ